MEDKTRADLKIKLEMERIQKFKFEAEKKRLD
jgi:hypothetical protein